MKKRWKALIISMAVIIVAGLVWAGLVYGPEFVEDTKNRFTKQENEQVQTQEPTTEAKIELTI